MQHGKRLCVCSTIGKFVTWHKRNFYSFPPIVQGWNRFHKAQGVSSAWVFKKNWNNFDWNVPGILPPWWLKLKYMTGHSQHVWRKCEDKMSAIFHKGVKYYLKTLLNRLFTSL